MNIAFSGSGRPREALEYDRPQVAFSTVGADCVYPSRPSTEQVILGLGRADPRAIASLARRCCGFRRS